MADPRTLFVAGALGVAAALARRARTYAPPAVWRAEGVAASKFSKTNRPVAGATHEAALPVGEHALQLYSLGTPNGVKVTILLEELAAADPSFEYDAWLTGIGGAQFGSGFVAVNPNSKIPALLDRRGGAGGGTPTRVFESGSILLYLCEKYDREGAFLPKAAADSAAARAEVLNWLMWQMGSAPYLGGGFGHFYSYAPVKIKYAVDRFTMEAKRQLDVLERVLCGADSPGGGGSRPFIAGERYSIADMAIWPWYGNLVLGRLYGAAEFLDAAADYPHVVAWARRVLERPAVQRGRMVNRTWGPKAEQLHNRHARSDFETQTQDKLAAPAE